MTPAAKDRPATPGYASPTPRLRPQRPFRNFRSTAQAAKSLNLRTSLTTSANRPCALSSQHDRKSGSVGPVALDLSAVHDAPSVRVERVAAMHRAAVVPHDQVARLPL